MTTPNVADLVSRLVAFDLDEAEARLFFELWSRGPSRAAEVAEAAQMPRTQVYRELEDLHAKGFVEKTLERPMRFVPVPLDVALERAVERRTEEVENLRQEKRRLARDWPEPGGSALEASDRFSVHQGRTQVRGLLERIIASASEEVLIVGSPRGLFRLDLTWLSERLSERAQAGVSARVMTRVDESNRQALAALADVVDVRHVELPSYHQMVLIDSKEVALFVSAGKVVSTSGREETVLWVGAQDFALAQKALFDRVWEDGISHSSRSDELLGRRPPDQATVLRGRFVRYDRMKRRLHRARKVTALVGRAEMARWEAAGITRRLKAIMEAGGEVRILTDAELTDLPVRPAGQVDPPLVFVVDGEETTLCFGTKDAPGTLTYDAEWSVFAASPRVGGYWERMLGATWEDPEAAGEAGDRHGMVV